MRVALVANPAARAGASSLGTLRAADRLRTLGVETTLVSGGTAAQTSELLGAALDAGCDAVVVAGGDGTVHLAIQALAGGDVSLGIVPLGTGNDTATSLGLHELDPDAAASVIAEGVTRRIDLARLSRRDGSSVLYGSLLASGFDARVNDRANRMHWPRGHARYNIALFAEFAVLRSTDFSVSYERADGVVETVEGPLLMATVGNGRTYGGGIPMCPDAVLDDGLLDLTLVRQLSRARMLRMLPRAYAGTHGDLDEVTMAKVRRVTIDAPGISAYADGEPMGLLPVSVEAVPSALTVFVPALTS